MMHGRLAQCLQGDRLLQRPGGRLPLCRRPAASVQKDGCLRAGGRVLPCKKPCASEQEAVWFNDAAGGCVPQ